MKCITGKYGWLLAISCWLLAVSCSSDGKDEQQTGSILQVMPYTANYQSNEALSRRAVSAGYSEYNPDRDISIGLFILPDPDEDNPPTAKLIRYNNGVWHSQAIVKTITYTIYGYMPKSIMSSISQSGGNAQLTLSGIDAVTAEDICFVTGVKDMEGDLLQGSFAYTGKSSDNYVRLLMDHLFASVKFNFSVDADYSALRTIKLKKMTISSPTTQKVNAVISLTNTTGTDPVTSVTYNTQTTGTSSATFFKSATGEELVTNAETIKGFSCCFAPGLSNDLSLECIYDVYDRKGNKIREDCTATNKLPNLNASRGQCVTINLKVAPTYLGQLSEQDLDNLDFTVN